ncbi:transcriptional regulator, GntR family [Granulicella rosea]|uniref:Transcriptional regulator, GntR family n=1 Tax=Granulicella rosea TaxID=474952 RepID=A0A239EMD2_9BACT|nr:FadR/GntR family transcriptional regulator [Granulicella rosea]SNS45805.1 transcriptional regulator, GntR family [Granulicella rosea]
MKIENTETSAGHSQLTMQVVDHVRGLVASGELRPGDRLPPERELAKKLKISRSSLRAGIGFLAAMGVLKSRHGAGTFVANGPPALDSSSLSVLGALHGFMPWQMFEARLVLEANIASLAAERATGEHIAELAEEVAEMYASLTDPQEYLIHDVRFHRTIARAAGNPILGALMETITANLYDTRRMTVDHSVDLKESAEMHREIYRAIRSKNPAGARQAMERHLNLARMAQASEDDTPEIVEAATAAAGVVPLPHSAAAAAQAAHPDSSVGTAVDES